MWPDEAVNFTRDIRGEKSYPFWWESAKSTDLGGREAKMLKNINSGLEAEMVLAFEWERGVEMV